MINYRYGFLIVLLWLGSIVHAQTQPTEDYVQAVTTYLQQETGKTPSPRDIVDTLNHLVVNFYQEGEYRTGLMVAEQTLHFAEQELGPRHPLTLTSVNNLALLYQSQGRYDDAEPLYQRALADFEKTLGPTHPDTLLSLNNLAGLYHAQGRYGEAEPLLQRALAAREKTLGSTHPDTLGSVNNLAELYRAQGRYGEAQPLYQRALADLEKTLGPTHPSTLTSVNSLAGLYQSQGRYGEAESLYQRALAAREKTLGPTHPDTLITQLNYTSTLVMLDRPTSALQLLERMELRLLELAALRLRTTRQERVRRGFLTDLSAFQDVVLTLALRQEEPGFLDLAAKIMLRWKHIQGEEDASLARLARRRSGENAEVRELANEIRQLRRALSHLVHHPEPEGDPQQGALSQTTLRNTLNELETKETHLARISREFNRHLQVREANADEVRAYLPAEKSALLELRHYQPVDFKTSQRAAPRWAALLLTSMGDMTLHDLGPVAKTQALWQELRQTGSRKAAAALYKNLFDSIDAQLKDYHTLYLAPDSFLNLIAFAQLVTTDGQYWIQRQELRQVHTGRHLIGGYDQNLDKPGKLLAVGGVDYERFNKTQLAEPIKIGMSLNLDSTVALRAIKDTLNRFAPLGETSREAKGVAGLYWKAWDPTPTIWLGTDASEAKLKAQLGGQAIPPKVLHLATHGFYLNTRDELVDRPMLLSGLALAGANQGLQGTKGPDGEDGILYALEVQDLNLEDTALVTLSACDTGVGTLDYSEGVYGLVRGFRIAGARNVLMSLQPLNDGATREFMETFYRIWLDGAQPKPLATALRETQLTFINDKESSWRDPNVWAPFVLVQTR